MRRASSALTLREVSSRYFAVASPQSVTSRAGPTGTPELGAREAHPQVRAADPQVARDGDLGATTHDRAVAGGDGGLREGRELVVEQGEELHPVDAALLVELLADVGPGGEAEVVVRGDHQDARLGVPPRAVEVGEELVEHLGVDRVARLARAPAAAARPASRPPSSWSAASVSGLLGLGLGARDLIDQPLHLVGGGLDQAAGPPRPAPGTGRGRSSRPPPGRWCWAAPPLPGPARSPGRPVPG